MLLLAQVVLLRELRLLSKITRSVEFSFDFTPSFIHFIVLNAGNEKVNEA